MKRPMSPEEFKDFIIQNRGKFRHGEPKVLASILTKILRNDTSRYLVQKYLFGAESIKNADIRDVRTVLALSGALRFNEPYSDAFAQEILAIYEKVAGSLLPLTEIEKGG